MRLVVRVCKILKIVKSSRTEGRREGQGCMPEWKHHQGVEVTEGMLVRDHHSTLNGTTTFLSVVDWLCKVRTRPIEVTVGMQSKVTATQKKKFMQGLNWLVFFSSFFVPSNKKPLTDLEVNKNLEPHKEHSFVGN